MKKILGFVCAATVALCCAFSFAGCGSAQVEYKISEDGTYYILSGVSGNQMALKECVIASEYDDGEHGSLPVTRIGSDAFVGCTSLSSVNIPSSITHIGARAFAYTKISSIEIPDSVTYIADSAFGACKVLKSVVIPSSVTYIGPFAFAYCSSLESVTVNAQVSEIYTSTFRGKYTFTESDVYSDAVLSSVTLPVTLEKIDIAALSYNPITDIYYGGTAAQWKEVKFCYYQSQASEDNPDEQEVVEVNLTDDEIASYMNQSYNARLSFYLLSSVVTVHCSDGTVVYSEGKATTHLS